MTKTIIEKAILLPINSNNELLVQDRENYKPPRFGFFGGSVEKNETILEALIREAHEELTIKIIENDVRKLGIFIDNYHESITEEIHVFILKTELKENEFELNEGKAAKYLSLEDAQELMRAHATPTAVSIIQSLRNQFVN